MPCRACFHVHEHSVSADGAKRAEPQLLPTPQHAQRFIALTFTRAGSLFVPQLKVSENVRRDELQGNGSKIDAACDLMHVARPFKNVNIIIL